MEKIEGYPNLVKQLIGISLYLKEYFMSRGYPTPLLDKTIFKRFRQQVGGRVRYILSGGAPLSRETHQFLRLAFSARVIQGYGLTETCGICSLQPLDALECNNVGAPVPSCEFKLVDCPELGYKSTNSTPQGEIWLRGPSVSSGYFNAPEKTAEAFMKDNWFATGDIGQLHTDGTLSIIDRKKNLVKLPDGEYIAVENLESQYKDSGFVANICIVTNPHKQHIGALVVPHKEYLLRWGKNNNAEVHDLSQAQNNTELKKAVLNSLQDVAKKAKLRAAEIIAAVEIVPDEWTPENELLTAAMKLKRQNIVKKYEDKVKNIFK